VIAEHVAEGERDAAAHIAAKAVERGDAEFLPDVVE
jgi:hypothetical protein